MRPVSDFAQPEACTQEFLRIHGFAVDARLIVKMRAGRASRRAYPADGFANADELPDLDADLRQVPVTARQSVAVIDLDHVAVTTLTSGDGHAAGGRCADRLSRIAAQVDAGMDSGPAVERVHAHAER